MKKHTNLKDEIYSYEQSKSNNLWLFFIFLVLIGTVVTLEIYNTYHADQFIQLKNMNQ